MSSRNRLRFIACALALHTTAVSAFSTRPPPTTARSFARKNDRSTHYFSKNRFTRLHDSRGSQHFEKIASTSTMALPLLMATDPIAAVASLGSTEAPQTAVAAFLSKVPSLDPSFEGQVFTDMAHVALDLATLVGPSKVLLQCCLVIGRLFAMAADYVPDHFMLPEEFVFQIFMLSLAWFGLAKSAAPMALASFASDIKPRDGKTFARLFEPAGTTWSQYKAMSVVALDWVEVKPNELITSDEKKAGSSDNYLYWLYAGDATVQSKGSFLYNVERAFGTDEVGLGLFGESRLLQRVRPDAKQKSGASSKAAVKRKSKQQQERNDGADYPYTTVHAGSKGATLLRIDASALDGLMAVDQDLKQCIRNLLFQGMQDKLVAKYNDASVQ